MAVEKVPVFDTQTLSGANLGAVNIPSPGRIITKMSLQPGDKREVGIEDKKPGEMLRVGVKYESHDGDARRRSPFLRNTVTRYSANILIPYRRVRGSGEAFQSFPTPLS